MYYFIYHAYDNEISVTHTHTHTEKHRKFAGQRVNDRETNTFSK